MLNVNELLSISNQYLLIDEYVMNEERVWLSV
jgi:hypothetical protein